MNRNSLTMPRSGFLRSLYDAETPGSQRLSSLGSPSDRERTHQDVHSRAVSGQLLHLPADLCVGAH